MNETSDRIEWLRTTCAERWQRVEDLRLFDANIWLGRPGRAFPLAEELTAEQLPGVMTEYRISGGLVSHWRARTLAASDGNAALRDAADRLPEGTHVVWTGLPLFPADAPPLPGDDVPEKVRAVRLFPKTHRFPLSAWSIGELLEWLIARNIPLLIQHTEFEWGELVRLLRAFPALNVIVESQPQKILYHARALFAAMRDFDNLFVETSNYTGAGFIEYTVEHFGAERLIFGSFLPVADPLVPIGMLLDAEISDRDRRLIAGENLRGMLGGTQQ